MASNGIVVIDGWELRCDPEVFGDNLPRIQDLELARRLAFDRPINIRNLIGRLAKNVNDFGFISTVEINHHGGRGRPGMEYWLTEAQAVVVIGRSDTPIALKIACEVARVFVEWRHGRLPAAPAVDFEALADRIVASIDHRIGQRFEQLAATSGYVASFTPVHGILSARSYRELCAMRERIVEIESEAAILEGATDKARAARKARSNVLGTIRRITGHGYRPGELLHQVPAEHEHKVFAALRAREFAGLERLDQLKRARQQKLDFSNN
jgi:hypothetical protein